MLCIPVRVSEFGIILGKCTTLCKIKSAKFPVYFRYKSKGRKSTIRPSIIGYFYFESFKNVKNFDFQHISNNSGIFGFGFGFDVLFPSIARVIFERFSTIKSPKSPKYWKVERPEIFKKRIALLKVHFRL